MAPMLMLDPEDDGSTMAEMVGFVEVVFALVVEVPLVLEELLLVLVLVVLEVLVLVLGGLDAPLYVTSTEDWKLDTAAVAYIQLRPLVSVAVRDG